jgi:hypothetical protein
MSATCDAYIVAVQRAFPDLDAEALGDLTERFFTGGATPAEAAAILAEFNKVTRADIGREPLP